MKENPVQSLPGIPTLLGILVAELAAVYLFLTGAAAAQGRPGNSRCRTRSVA